jgi:hypothetical protein
MLAVNHEGWGSSGVDCETRFWMAPVGYVKHNRGWRLRRATSPGRYENGDSTWIGPSRRSVCGGLVLGEGVRLSVDVWGRHYVRAKNLK